MSTDHKLERNSLILAATEVLIKLLGISTTIIVARLLGPDDFGLLSFAYVVANVFLVLPDFGFNRLTVREVARREGRASRFLHHITAIKGVLYFPALLACALFIFFSFDDWRERLAFVLLVFLVEVVRQHMVFFCSFFRAIQQMEWEALVRSSLAVLSLALSVPILLLGFGLYGLMWVRLLVTAFCIGLAIYLLRKFGLRLVRLSWRYVKRLLLMASPLALFTLCIMIYMQINVLILGVAKDDAEVGFYYIAATIVGPLNIISDAIAESSLPQLSRYWSERNLTAFHNTIRKAFRYLLLLALPLAAGLIVLAKAGVVLLFGEDYLPSVAALIVLGFSLIPDFLNTVLSATLISMDKERTTLLATVLGAVAAVVSGLIFIPLWGATGAAVAWLTAELTVCVFQLSILYREFLTLSNFWIALRILLAALSMGGLVYFADQSGAWLVFSIALGLLSYPLLLWALGELRREEVVKLIAMLRNRAQTE